MAKRKNLKDRKLIENDPYLNKSKDHLRYLLYNQIKNTFVGSLSAVENKLGKDFSLYPQLRAEILRVGNNEIRKMHKILDSFNIEAVSFVDEFENQEKRQGENDGKIN